jgi:hypothetical protein
VRAINSNPTEIASASSVVSLAHHISHTRLAIDRGLHRLQRRNIAVNRAHRHFQHFGQLAGKNGFRRTAQNLNDLEKPGVAGHGAFPVSGNHY